MKKIFLFILAIPLLLSACRIRQGSGNIVSEIRATGSFSGVSVSNAFEVEWRKGPVTSVKIEADDNLIDDVETRVSNGVLHIGLNDGSINNATLRAYIVSPSLNKIEASSAASFRTIDQIKDQRKISLQASSAAEIEADVDAPEVKADGSSGSEIQVKGRTRVLDAEASSGSTVKAYGLLSEESKARSSSGSTVEIYASLKVDASASSGASVRYRGGATDVRKSESSGGGVNRD